MRETYFDDAESRDWILSTHCRDMLPCNKDLIRRCTSAFILYGNEDAPERIEFFQTNTPMYDEEPMIVFVPE